MTARGEIEDRVQGLHAGAVDYMVKPFAVAELDARIRAQLRAARQSPTTTLRRAGLEVDLLSRQVRQRRRAVRLSNTEFELLAYLMQHPGRVLTREQIHRAVWNYRHDPATNIVDVYIGYLRRKLRTDGRAVPISTVRARGYRLEAQRDPAVELRWRLVAWVTGVLLLVCAVIFVVIYQETTRQLRSQIDTDVTGDVSQLSQVVRALKTQSPADAAARYRTATSAPSPSAPPRRCCSR